MLKNLSIGTLLGSKTFWGALIAFGGAAAHSYGLWKTGNQATAVAEFTTALGALLAAIGIKDATSGPIN